MSSVLKAIKHIKYTQAPNHNPNSTLMWSATIFHSREKIIFWVLDITSDTTTTEKCVTSGVKGGRIWSEGREASSCRSEDTLGVREGARVWGEGKGRRRETKSSHLCRGRASSHRSIGVETPSGSCLKRGGRRRVRAGI
jgi:hypothetical protein